MRTLATMVAALAVFAAGCADDQPTTPTVPPATTTAGGSLVVYERSGGVAYTAQRLVVEEDGAASVTVEGPGEIGADFELSEEELGQLRDLLADATFESPEPSGCADCYVYVIRSGGETASFDQTSIPAGTEPLVDFLSQIVERETPTGPARDAK